jgi:CDP-diacylglycerol--glycerol-3-phosphate 3-phosphatidyltransferase
MSRGLKLAFVTFLTVARLPLVLLFFAGAIIHASYPAPWLFWITFASLVLSALTDLFDGYYARKFKVVTQFGAHVDPLMDKFFYLASLPLLVYVMAIDKSTSHADAAAMLVLTLVFLARDQWITFLRSIGAIYQVSGKANWSGKLRTALNFPMICVVYYHEEAPQHLQFIPEPYRSAFVYAFVLLTLVITILSLFIYTRHYWPYLRKAADVNSPQT